MVTSVRNPVVVVSADAHVGPLASQLRDYVPKALHDDLDAYYKASAQASAAAEAAMARRVGALTGNVTRPAMDWNRQSAGHHDHGARIADMDRDGVVAEVLFHGSQNGEPIPFQSLRAALSGQSLGAEARELEAVGKHAYNEWLADFCAEAPERHIGLCQITIWDLEAATREVVWAHEHGLKGVNFPSPNPSLPSFEDPIWDPFFAVCAERNMVLNTHVGSTVDLEPRYLGPGAQSIRFVEQNWLGRRAMWLLTFTGAFDRHPDLKLVITELPGAWFASTIREMEATFYNPLTGANVQALLRHAPSYYAERNLFMGASYQSRQEACTAVEEDFAGHLMWGSDYPHIEGTWRFPQTPDEPPTTRLALANTFHGLPEDAVRQMCGENTMRVYGLDRAPLEAMAERIGPAFEDIDKAPDLSQVPEGYVGFGFRTRGAYS
jgi:predicted TIM-barrel fold metal-dependent hydrolase